MNVFYLEWNSFCNEDMFDVLRKKGHNIVRIPFSNASVSEEQVKKLLAKSLKKSSCSFVFSFNYFPAVSNACKELEMKYVSWVYDSPYIHVYSYTVLNECNYIFLFDYAVYEELKNGGIKTVYYLPLAVNIDRISKLKNSSIWADKYACDVSFVGSLYSEAKHRIYDRFKSISEYAKGYLDGMIQAQLKVYGCNFLKDMLTEDILLEMQNAYPTNPNDTTVLSPEAIYGDYVLSRQVTAIERKEILALLGEKYNVKLYTYDSTVDISGVENCGLLDYYNEMPYAFFNSKVNLNITLRSIKTGIPLRVMDIMGCGGFLCTNYQEEMLQYFVPDEDFVYYSDYDDLLIKTDYYLSHEKERKEIGENGRKKVFSEHTLSNRLDQILQTISHENKNV